MNDTQKHFSSVNDFIADLLEMYKTLIEQPEGSDIKVMSISTSAEDIADLLRAGENVNVIKFQELSFQQETLKHTGAYRVGIDVILILASNYNGIAKVADMAGKVIDITTDYVPTSDSYKVVDKNVGNINYGSVEKVEGFIFSSGALNVHYDIEVDAFGLR